MKRNNLTLGMMIPVLASLAGCGQKINPVQYGGDPDISQAVTYCSQIQPILENRCTACHSRAVQGPARHGAPVSINFDTYADAQANAARADARIQAGTMPPSGGIPAKERALFSAWIGSGAPPGCDGADGGNDGGVELDGDGGSSGDGNTGAGITYCGQIRPFLDLNCTGCHSGALQGTARNGAPEGVNFDTYARAASNSSRANIRIQAGTMPPGVTLSDADRALFAAWVAAGTPECGGPDGGVDGGGGPTCVSGSHWTAGQEPSATMRPGENCASCHNDATASRLAVGGTVMGGLHDEDDCNGVPGVVVEITQNGGQVVTFTSNSAGNFAAQLEDTAAIVPPFTVRLSFQSRERRMTAQQSDSSCNSCHSTSGANGAPGRIVAP